MFGGSGKLGRGGSGGVGRGGVKRSLPPPAPPSGLHRPSATSARAPIGRSSAARNRLGSRGATAAPPTAREESFSLVRGEPDFAAIVRLTPDLVEEIRQAEAHGGAARIRFDSNPNNSSDNVIDVGGKEFRFTWSKEPGDLCDIYEERRSGEDGHGLLVECGSAWRKLNVERVLDESTKNHVKKLSEEAERQMKSRKAIVLDPTNPSVKNQVKSMAAAGVDGSMRRMGWMPKKENLFKKRKVESNQVSHTATGQAKLGFNSVSSSKNPTKRIVSLSPKGRVSLSPQPPQPSHEQSGARNSSNLEDSISPLNIVRDDVGNLEKAIPSNAAHGSMNEVIVRKCGITDQPMDLTSILISLLSEHPNGLTLKALEKAAGEVVPNSAKKIENIIKNIATIQASGKCFLKPDLEVDIFKGGVSVNGSSPEGKRDHISAPVSISDEEATTGNNERLTKMNLNADEVDPFEMMADEVDPFKMIDGKQNDPDPYKSEIKVNNNDEGRACSSSESGSDSESETDSSDSGSDSGSQSKSRSKSPVGSRSGSSSDSESDGPASNKEGSDEEVDIMTSDDEKDGAEQKKELAELKLSSSPRAATPSEGEHEKINISENDQEGQVASLRFDMDGFGRGEEMSHKTGNTMSSELDPYQTNSRISDQMISHPDQYERVIHNTDKQVDNGIGEKQSTISNDRRSLDHPNISERNPKSKSKRASSSGYFEDKLESDKRVKASNSSQDTFTQQRDANLLEYSNYRSPDRPKENLPVDPIANKVELDWNTGINLQEYSVPENGRTSISKNSSRIQQNLDFWSSTSVDGGQTRPRVGDPNSGRRVIDSMEKPQHVEDFFQANKHGEGLSTHPLQDKSSLLIDKPHNDMPDENGDTSESYAVRKSRESSVGGKLSSTPDSYNRKPFDNSGHAKDTRHQSNVHKYENDKSPAVSGKGRQLRRELSDLELGELREPPAEERDGVREQFERKGAFKPLEDKITASTYLDTSKGRNAPNVLIESKRESPAKTRNVNNGNHNGFNRKIPVLDRMGTTLTQQKEMPSQSQHLSTVDNIETESEFPLNTSAEMIRTDKGSCWEKQPRAQRKLPDSMRPQCETKHGGRIGNTIVREIKPQYNALRDSLDESNNMPLVENGNHGGKRRGTSSNEEFLFLAKYDRDKPELKGPIKNFSLYKEYVQEYREKYEHYCSLNRNLENMRSEFVKVGDDLKTAKGRDREEYCNIVGQLKEMYNHLGERHKQMKKVFILLHEEVKILKQRIKDFAQTYLKE